MACRRAQGRRPRPLPLQRHGSQLEHVNGALISGCRSDQTSADAVFGGRPNGALTYFLLEALGETLLFPLKAVVDSTVRALESGGYDQVPQLRGDPGITGKSFLAVSKTTPASPRKTAVAVTVPPPIAAVPAGALCEIFDALAKIASGHADAGHDGGGGETAVPQDPMVSGNITLHF